MTEIGDVGAVIVHYDHFPAILDTIAGCVEQGLEESQIVVVDNGGPEPLRGHVTTTFPRVSVLDDQGNVGYAGAVNRGVEWARQHGFDWVLVLTHEVEMSPGCVAVLRAAVEVDRAIAIAAPGIYRKNDNNEVWSFGGDLDPRTYYPHARTAATSSDPVWVDGCCFLLRASAHRDVGGLFEPYFLYFEEVDLCVRLQRSGYRIVVDTGARAFQEPGGMSFYLATRNRILLARRIGGVSAVARIAAVHAVKLLLEPVVQPRTGWSKSRERGRGLWEGLTVGRDRRSALRTAHRYRSNLKATFKYLFGRRPRAVLVWLGAWMAGPPRAWVLRRLGVRNDGQIARGVRFANASVRVGDGAHVGRGCRFEGGAAIVIEPGVKVAPRCRITTRVGGDPSVDWDVPLLIAKSVTKPGATVTPASSDASAQ